VLNRVLPAQDQTPWGSNGGSDRHPQSHHPLLNPDTAKENEALRWVLANVIRSKYPMIHREILVGALEYTGQIQLGADPDFPDSVIATVPGYRPPLQEPRP
jgi:hypothetical protein